MDAIMQKTQGPKVKGATVANGNARDSPWKTWVMVASVATGAFASGYAAKGELVGLQIKALAAQVKEAEEAQAIHGRKPFHDVMGEREARFEVEVNRRLRLIEQSQTLILSRLPPR